MVARNNNNTAFLLPRSIVEALFRLFASLVTMLLIVDFAALVFIGVTVGTHLHANPEEPLLQPTGSAQLYDLLQQHNRLPSSAGISAFVTTAADGGNFTGGCAIANMTWTEVWTAAPVFVEDHDALYVVLDSMMHHVHKSEPWIQILGGLCSLLSYKFMTWYWWSRRDESGSSSISSPNSRIAAAATNRLRALVGAALKKHRVIIAAPTRLERNGGGSSGACSAIPTDGGVCGICLDGLHPIAKNHLVEGCCRHTFHDQCISDWLCRGDSQSHYQCPLCRQDFLDAATTRKLRRYHCQSNSSGIFVSSSSLSSSS